MEFTNSSEFRLAREAFERSLRSAEDAVARLGLGYLDFLDQRDETARENLKRAAQESPNDAQPQKLLGLIEYREGELAAALTHMERATALDRQDREAEALKAAWQREVSLSKAWGESSTRHFRVRYGREIHEEAVREILQALDGIHDSVGRSLGHWPRRAVPVILLTEKDFYSLTGSFHWVGGVYDGQIKVPIEPADTRPGAERRELHRTLRHEFVHAVVKELCPGCPNWLNEGIAQHFEIDDGIDNRAAGSPSSGRNLRESRRQKLIEDLRKHRDRKIPFERVPVRLSEIADQSLARWTYLQGLGFTTYLAERHQAFRLRLLLASLRQDGSLAKAFETTYGASLADLEKEWWQSLEP